MESFKSQVETVEQTAQRIMEFLEPLREITQKYPYGMKWKQDINLRTDLVYWLSRARSDYYIPGHRYGIASASIDSTPFFIDMMVDAGLADNPLNFEIYMPAPIPSRWPFYVFAPNVKNPNLTDSQIHSIKELRDHNILEIAANMIAVNRSDQSDVPFLVDPLYSFKRGIPLDMSELAPGSIRYNCFDAIHKLIYLRKEIRHSYVEHYNKQIYKQVLDIMKTFGLPQNLYLYLKVKLGIDTDISEVDDASMIGLL